MKPGWTDLFFGTYGFRAALLPKESLLAKELRRRGWRSGSDGPRWGLLPAPGVGPG